MDAPIVCIPNCDGSIRIRRVYKVINPWLEVSQYPIPKPPDLLARLAGRMKFTKLDLSQAYEPVAFEPAQKNSDHEHTQGSI